MGARPCLFPRSPKLFQHTCGRRAPLVGFLVGALALCVALWPTPSSAAPENITDGELALTPAYCQDVQAIRYGNASYNPSPRAPYWVSLMGQAFWALHHYCWGLIHVRRADAPGLPLVQRVGMLNSAVNDYFYVINNAPKDFVLAPEIYLRIGEARMAMGQVGLAHDAFRISRELKPDYWPAYTRWIDHLLRTNQTAAAKNLAAEGLRFAPGSTELADRYRKLGGNPGAIVAAGPAASVPTPANASPPMQGATRPSATASAPSESGVVDAPSAPASAGSR